MKSHCYLQLIPRVTSKGVVTGFSVKNASKRAPTAPIAGALVILLDVEVPDAAFKPIGVTVKVPMDAIARQAPIVAEVRS